MFGFEAEVHRLRLQLFLSGKEIDHESRTWLVGTSSLSDDTFCQDIQITRWLGTAIKDTDFYKIPIFTIYLDQEPLIQAQIDHGGGHMVIELVSMPVGPDILPDIQTQHPNKNITAVIHLYSIIMDVLGYLPINTEYDGIKFLDDIVKRHQVSTWTTKRNPSESGSEHLPLKLTYALNGNAIFENLEKKISIKNFSIIRDRDEPIVYYVQSTGSIPFNNFYPDPMNKEKILFLYQLMDQNSQMRSQRFSQWREQETQIVNDVFDECAKNITTLSTLSGCSGAELHVLSSIYCFLSIFSNIILYGTELKEEMTVLDKNFSRLFPKTSIIETIAMREQLFPQIKLSPATEIFILNNQQFFSIIPDIKAQDKELNSLTRIYKRLSLFSFEDPIQERGLKDPLERICAPGTHVYGSRGGSVAMQKLIESRTMAEKIFTPADIAAGIILMVKHQYNFPPAGLDNKALVCYWLAKYLKTRFKITLKDGFDFTQRYAPKFEMRKLIYLHTSRETLKHALGILSNAWSALNIDTTSSSTSTSRVPSAQPFFIKPERRENIIDHISRITSKNDMLTFVTGIKKPDFRPGHFFDSFKARITEATPLEKNFNFLYDTLVTNINSTLHSFQHRSVSTQEPRLDPVLAECINIPYQPTKEEPWIYLNLILRQYYEITYMTPADFQSLGVIMIKFQFFFDEFLSTIWEMHTRAEKSLKDRFTPTFR